jgi:3-oxoadipate enol-lactonase
MFPALLEQETTVNATTNSGKVAVTAGRAAARDGTAISYRVFGATDQAPRVVLLHSLALNGEFWEPVAQILARRVPLLAVDCRGHGASDKPAGPYTAAQMADDVADVLDQLGAKKVVVAGASMGGCVSLSFAGAYPQRTAALGLFDTTAWYGETAPADWNQRAAKAQQTGLASLVDFQKTRWFGDAFRDAHPELVAHFIDIFLHNDVNAYAEACKMMGSFDGRALLPKLKMPVAVVVGEEDYAAPVAMSELMHKGIAGSTLMVIPKARHLTPLECPEIIADVLDKLLAQAA